MKVVLQRRQLIIFTLVIGKNGNAIIKLHRVRIRRVIHENNSRGISIQPRKIFDEQLRSQLSTVLTVESMVEEDSFRINLIQNCICVLLLARSKYNYFPSFSHFLQKGYRVWSQIHSNIKLLSINADCEANIRLALCPLKAM